MGRRECDLEKGKASSNICHLTGTGREGIVALCYTTEVFIG
jgi:hypothetical protein